ncbi:MAG: RpiB/LacA/LacB family sugar-phosphate isomerase [Patescibacteria group bacterium]
MLIYIGADHRGFHLKEFVKKFLKESGREVVDVGNAEYNENDDYPDFAKAAAKAVSENLENRRGIVICGSGVGVDIVANKFDGIRSALANNVRQAILSRKDDDANVLALAAEFINEEEAKKILTAWLETPFSKEEKYKRRLAKINEYEKEN